MRSEKDDFFLMFSMCGYRPPLRWTKFYLIWPVTSQVTLSFEIWYILYMEVYPCSIYEKRFVNFGDRTRRTLPLSFPADSRGRDRRSRAAQLRHSPDRHRFPKAADKRYPNQHQPTGDSDRSVGRHSPILSRYTHQWPRIHEQKNSKA